MNIAKASAWATLLSLPLYAQAPPARGINFYTIDEEVRIGARSAETLARTLPMVREPRLDAYLARLVDALAPPTGVLYSYSVSVYEDRKPLGAQPVAMTLPRDAFHSPAVEVIALAGGPMLVPLSLLAGAETEAEFAYRLAHAMAHIRLRHATRLATREQIAAIAMAPIKLTDSAALDPQTLLRLGMLVQFSRYELDAEAGAVEMMAAAGYDPQAAIRYLEREPPADSRRVSGMFAGYPTSARRRAAITAAIEKLPARAYPADSGSFEEMRALASTLR